MARVSIILHPFAKKYYKFTFKNDAKLANYLLQKSLHSAIFVAVSNTKKNEKSINIATTKA